MELSEIIKKLNLEILTINQSNENTNVSGGYTSDLLSCVMAGAKKGDLWVTLQAHMNIVAVAALLDLTAIIITEGARPDQSTLLKAQEQSVVLLGSKEPSFSIVGKLWELGIRSD